MTKPSEVIARVKTEVWPVYKDYAAWLEQIEPIVKQLEQNNITLAISIPIDLAPKKIGP